MFVKENSDRKKEKDGNLLVHIDKKFNSLIGYIEKRFHILEDQIIVMQNINLTRDVANPATLENGLYVDLLKNRISELEKQLTEKYAVISYLTTQLATKSTVIKILRTQVALI